MTTFIETQYARSGDANLDLVLLPGAFSHVEHQWEKPSFARFLHRLASFSRLIVLDDAVELRAVPHSGEKLLHLVEKRVLVADIRKVVATG